MKNHKQLICGILIGAVATLSITALAEYVINPNPYPVKVNGQTVQIEGYNINDSTYFKLRDISAAVGGLEVGFTNDTITISTPTVCPEPTDAPSVIPTTTSTSAQHTPNPKLPAYRYDENTEFTSDGLPIEVLEDGNKYVYTGDIKTVYNFNDNGYKFGVGRIADSNYAVVVDNIQIAPDTIRANTSYIDLSYYETTLSSWLNEYCK